MAPQGVTCKWPMFPCRSMYPCDARLVPARHPAGTEWESTSLSPCQEPVGARTGRHSLRSGILCVGGFSCFFLRGFGKISRGTLLRRMERQGNIDKITPEPRSQSRGGRPPVPRPPEEAARPLANPHRGPRGGDHQHAARGAHHFVVKIDAHHRIAAQLPALLLHLLEGDAAGPFQLPLVGTAPSADDVPQAGHEVPEDI